MSFRQQVIIAVLFINLAVLAVSGYWLARSHEQHQVAAQMATGNLADLLMRQIGSMYDATDRALLVVADEFHQQRLAARFVSADVELALKRQQERNPFLSSMRIADASGNIVFGGALASDGTRVNLANRPYFQMQRVDPGRGLLVSEVVRGAVSGKRIIILSHALRDETGRFLGIVAAGIDLNEFSSLFAAVRLGPDGSIGLRDRNLRLIERFPKIAGQTGEPGSTRVATDFTEMLAQSPKSGSYRAGKTSIDGIVRRHSYRQHPSFGFYVNVGIAEDEAMAGWYRQLSGSTALMVLLLLLSGLAGRRMLKDHARSVGIALERDQSEATLQTLVESSPLAMIVATPPPEGRVLLFNKCFTTTFGYRIEDIPDLEHWWPTVYPDPAYRQDVMQRWSGLMQRMASAGLDHLPEPFPAEITCKEGAKRFVEINLTVQPNRVLVLFSDLTERRQAEVAIRSALQAEQAANEGKSRFLAAASHDLRQPLQALGLFLEALRRTPLDAEQERLLSFLSQSQRSQANILNTLLDLSRLDTGAVTVTHREERVASFLGSLVEEFSPVAQAKGLRLMLYLPRRDLMMRTDPGLLHSLMRNLVDNAIKYTYRGGVLIAARTRGEKILLQIWDTGRGIPENLRESIFEEYVQLDNAHRDQANGLGLGLAIVRRLSQLLNLTIRVDSRVGRGSVFSLCIPPAVSASPSQDDHRAPSPGETGAHRKRGPVVVVDDDHFALEALASALRSHGFAVEAFAEAESVLDRANFAAQTIFVVDYRLPGMSGKELLERLGTRSGHAVRGIIVSGDVGNPDLAHAGQVWPVLIKPVALHRLMAALDVLSGPPSP